MVQIWYTESYTNNCINLEGEPFAYEKSKETGGLLHRHPDRFFGRADPLLRLRLGHPDVADPLCPFPAGLPDLRHPVRKRKRSAPALPDSGRSSFFAHHFPVLRQQRVAVLGHLYYDCLYRGCHRLLHPAWEFQYQQQRQTALNYLF